MLLKKQHGLVIHGRTIILPKTKKLTFQNLTLFTYEKSFIAMANEG